MAFRVLCVFTWLAWSKSLCVSAALRDDLCAPGSLWFDLAQKRAFFHLKAPACPRFVRSRRRKMGWSPRWGSLPGDNQTVPHRDLLSCNLRKNNANSSNNSNPVLTAEETLVVTLLYNIENIQTQQPRTDIRSMMPIPTFWVSQTTVMTAQRKVATSKLILKYSNFWLQW